AGFARRDSPDLAPGEFMTMSGCPASGPCVTLPPFARISAISWSSQAFASAAISSSLGSLGRCVSNPLTNRDSMPCAGLRQLPERPGEVELVEHGLVLLARVGPPIRIEAIP